MTFLVEIFLLGDSDYGLSYLLSLLFGLIDFVNRKFFYYGEGEAEVSLPYFRNRSLRLICSPACNLVK